MFLSSQLTLSSTTSFCISYCLRLIFHGLISIRLSSTITNVFHRFFCPENHVLSRHKRRSADMICLS